MSYSALLIWILQFIIIQIKFKKNQHYYSQRFNKYTYTTKKLDFLKFGDLLKDTAFLTTWLIY